MENMNHKNNTTEQCNWTHCISLYASYETNPVYFM